MHSFELFSLDLDVNQFTVVIQHNHNTVNRFGILALRASKLPSSVNFNLSLKQKLKLTKAILRPKKPKTMEP